MLDEIQADGTSITTLKVHNGQGAPPALSTVNYANLEDNGPITFLKYGVDDEEGSGTGTDSYEFDFLDLGSGAELAVSGREVTSVVSIGVGDMIGTSEGTIFIGSNQQLRVGTDDIPVARVTSGGKGSTKKE